LTILLRSTAIGVLHDEHLLIRSNGWLRLVSLGTWFVANSLAVSYTWKRSRGELIERFDTKRLTRGYNRNTVTRGAFSSLVKHLQEPKMLISVESFDRDRFLDSATLFSPPYEDRTRFAYHGTSSVYATQIESKGLGHDFRAVDAEELRALAASLPAAAVEMADLLRNHASQPTRLGFSPYAYAAVDYALNGGGQIVNLCREAIKAGAHPSHSLQVFTDEFLDAGGTVYAFDLSGFDTDALTFEGIFLQCSSPVSASLICAKVEIPANFSRNDLKQIRNPPQLYRARLEPGTLAQRIYARTRASLRDDSNLDDRE
jgi:hypothetical protein